MLPRLPTAHVIASNTSDDFLNNIGLIVYQLYYTKQIAKKVMII